MLWYNFISNFTWLKNDKKWKKATTCYSSKMMWCSLRYNIHNADYQTRSYTFVNVKKKAINSFFFASQNTDSQSCISKAIYSLGNFPPTFSLNARQCLVLFLLLFSFSLPLDTFEPRHLWKTSYSECSSLLIFVLLRHPLIALCDFGNQFCAVWIRYEVKSSCPVSKEYS